MTQTRMPYRSKNTKGRRGLRRVWSMLLPLLCGSISALYAADTSPTRAVPAPLAELNSAADDYAVAFRTGDSAYEVWLTTGADHTDRRSRAIKSARSGASGMAALEPVRFTISGAETDSLPQDVVLEGSPAFALCNPDFGIVVLNRLVEGRTFENDLYEIHRQGATWQARRISSLNTAYWEDTPALSPDGNLLVFASDRRYRGGRRSGRRADLYYARRGPAGWSEPRLLESVSTGSASQECPHFGPGCLYYSSDAGGDYDIWRAELGADGLPVAAGSPLDPVHWPGVNRKGSDETHPVLSPGSNWLLYSSNYSDTGRKDFDVYALAQPVEPAAFKLRLRLRKPNMTPQPPGAPVQVRIREDHGADYTLTTDQLGDAHVAVQPHSGHALYDPFARRIIVEPEALPAHILAFPDTLIFKGACAQREHVQFLWDTTTTYEAACREDFHIYDVRFFVTGYWCPTTERYRRYAPCNSLFVSRDCMQTACESNDLYGFKVIRTELQRNCIDYGEFREYGARFAQEVDSAIALLSVAMESVFDRACMQRAIEQGKAMKVEVIGFTDSRSIRPECRFTGQSVDFSKSFVQVTAADSADRNKAGAFFVQGQQFRAPGYGGQSQGNQFLSDLRAYNTAVLLDELWSESIPDYRALKNMGLLSVEAYGQGISNDERLSDPRKRSIRVRVSVPEADEVRGETVVVSAGRTKLFCTVCGNENAR